MKLAKKVEFMLDKLGEEYDGVITGVAQFGLFVELDTLFVEGLVHITWLPDYFIFYPERFCLVGQHTGQPTAWATACACGSTTLAWRASRSILPYSPSADPAGIAFDSML